MKTASELIKSLDEALKPDTSGKTTPIQRLTPFLRLLIEHLEENETAVLSLIHAIPAIEARVSGAHTYSCGCTWRTTQNGYVQTMCEKHAKELETGNIIRRDLDRDELGRDREPVGKVSSNAATQVVPASPTNEPGDASKATA